MAFNIGVNVLEVDGRASPAIAAAPISVAAFLIASERGIPNVPVAVRGPVDLGNSFGQITAAAAKGVLAIRGFFDNGGSESVVVRITNSAFRPSVVVLKDRAGAPADTLRVAAGSRGREDPGKWGDSLSVVIEDHPRASSGVPAQLISAAAEPYALAGMQLDVTPNGGALISIPFAAADFVNAAAGTAAEVAAVINRRTTQVRAAATPDQKVIIASAVAGTSSNLVIGGTAAAATAGLLNMTASSGANITTASTQLLLQTAAGLVVGSAFRAESAASAIGTPLAPAVALAGPQPAINVTVNAGPAVTVEFRPSDFASGSLATALIGEIASVISRVGQGQFVAGLTADSKLVIRTARYGSTMAIAVGAPPGPMTSAVAALGLGVGVVITPGRVEYQEVSAVSEQPPLVVLKAVLTQAFPVVASRAQSLEFDLAVRRGAVEVERHESVSMQKTVGHYVEKLINDQDRGSRYVTVTDVGAAGVGANVPAERRDALGRLVATQLGSNNGIALTFQAGAEATLGDIDFIGDGAARTGLYALDTSRIQLLAIPDTQSPGVTGAALSYCERRGDSMFVGCPPQGYDLDGAKSYAGPFRGRKVFGAMYWPWIDVVNPLDATGNAPRLTVPPVGHVLGVYARIGDARGVWKAPAGDEANVRDAIGVERDISDVDHTDLVKNGGVNAIRAIPGSGIIIDSSRTLSTDTRWLFVGTRRLFNFVKLSLKDGLRWVAQEPHSDALRRAVRFNVVTPFLLGLWRQGAFGTDQPDDLFTVICDATNNPPAEVNLGNFRVEVYFYPVKPAETIIIVVGQQESGASASDT
jgi:phage tail sheath protein FI